MGAIEAATAWAPFLRLPESLTGESLRVTAGVTYLGRNDKARQALGFAVRSLEAGLRETLPAL